MGGDLKTYRRLLRYITPYRWLFVFSIIGFLMAAGAEGYFVKLFGELIDEWDEPDLRIGAAIPIMMCVAALVRAVGTILGETLMSRISFNMVYNLRAQLFDQLLKLPSSYFDANSQGHIVSRITFTVTQLRDTGTDVLRAIIQDGVKVLVLIGFMLFLNWKLTLLFIASAPLLGLIVMFSSSRFRKISRRIQRSMGDVTQVASEVVSGYKLVRTFGGQDAETKRFLSASRVNRQQNLKMTITRVFSAQLNETIIAVALSGLILLLYQPSIGGGLSGGEAVMFLSWAGMLGKPIRKLSEINAKLQRGIAAAEDVFSQLDSDIEIDAGRAYFEDEAAVVQFKKVQFRYSPDAPYVVSDFDLSLMAGSRVALVGSSGGGKTTIASLIPRFYDVSGGGIYLNGKDVRDYDLVALRKQIGLVSQEITLFNSTLRENLAYGDLHSVSEEDIWEALRRANAAGFVKDLPEGLDTVIGDDGVLLSGGQKQRIGIARAILKDAPILILDEATSALDSESEQMVQQALDEVMVGRTTLVIAHRLSTIEAADQIVVLEGGKIVESGVHKDLLEQSGRYAELHAAQFREQDVNTEKSGFGPSEQTYDKVPFQDSTAPASKTIRGYYNRYSSLIVNAWYEERSWIKLLAPLSWLYGKIVDYRRKAFESRDSVSKKAGIPVLVVGNLTVGGAGKTPSVLAIAKDLLAIGFTPGILSRGYRSRLGKQGCLVPSRGDARDYGDEALLLKKRSGCPVAISAKRARGIDILFQSGCDIVVADDGLQNLSLPRDLEVVVIDGLRGFGNGRLLPAGPLREPIARLDSVDLVLSSDRLSGLDQNEFLLEKQPMRFVNMSDSRELRPSDFMDKHPIVNAVCGIGNPLSFQRTLHAIGLETNLLSFPDHYSFLEEDLLFANQNPVVVTEKDMVKMRDLNIDLANFWYLEIEAMIISKNESPIEKILLERNISPKTNKKNKALA